MPTSEPLSMLPVISDFKAQRDGFILMPEHKRLSLNMYDKFEWNFFNSSLNLFKDFVW